MVQKHNRTQWQNHYSTDLSKLIIFCFFIFLLLLLLCYFLLLFSQISDRATSCNWQYRSDISSLFDWSRPAQRHTISIRKLAQVQCFFPFVMEISFEIVGNFPPQSRCSACNMKKGQVVLSSFGYDSYFFSFRLNEPKGGGEGVSSVVATLTNGNSLWFCNIFVSLISVSFVSLISQYGTALLHA